MIRHRETPGRTVVSDARGCLGIFGGLFVVGGLLAIAVGLSDPDAPATARLVALVVGAANVAGGLWVAVGTTRVSVVDGAGVTVETRRGVWLADSRRVHAPEIAAVTVAEGRDSDGDATFAPALRLHSGETLALTAQTTPSADVARPIAEAVARRLGVPERVEW